MKSKSQHPLVMVEWKDSAQPISSWLYLTEIDDRRAVTVKSVGFMVHSDKDVKILAPNLAQMGLESDRTSPYFTGPDSHGKIGHDSLYEENSNNE